MSIRQSLLMAALLSNAIYQASAAVETIERQDEVLPLFLESRLYAGDTSAFSTTLNTQAWGWIFKAGGIASFDGLGSDSAGNVDIELGVTRPFVLGDDLTMGLGVGAVSTDFFADYSLSYAATERVSLMTGYRFNFIDTPDNRHQLFLGVHYAFGAAARVPVPAPDTADINMPSQQIDAEPFVLNGRVDFASNSHQPLNTTFLGEVVEQLVYYPNAQVSVIGYADNSGNQADNLLLSEARANTVVAYLIERGMPPLQIQKMALGDVNPLASNSTADGRAKNRRVEVFLTEKPAAQNG